MTASNMLASYLGAIVALLLAGYFLNRMIRKYLDYDPADIEETSPAFELEMTHYYNWKYRLEQDIVTIETALTEANQNLGELRSLPDAELNLWEKLCYGCTRVGSRLWIYFVTVADLMLLVWLLFAAAAVPAIIKAHPDFLLSPGKLPDPIPDSMKGEPLSLALSATYIGGGLLTLGAVMWLLAALNTPRLKCHLAYVKAQTLDIPLMVQQINWLECQLDAKRGELAGSIASERQLAE